MQASKRASSNRASNRAASKQANKQANKNRAPCCHTRSPGSIGKLMLWTLLHGTSPPVLIVATPGHSSHLRFVRSKQPPFFFLRGPGGGGLWLTVLPPPPRLRCARAARSTTILEKAALEMDECHSPVSQPTCCMALFARLRRTAPLSGCAVMGHGQRASCRSLCNSRA